MKQCPTCKVTYTDTTLSFCLDDGSALFEAGTEAETVVRPGVRVDIPTTAYPTIPSGPPRKGSSVLKIVVAVLAVGLIGLLVAAAAGVFFYLNSGRASVTASSTPQQTPQALTTPDPEKERLEKELANLQRQLEDANVKVSPSKTPPGFESDEFPTARVNSPGDGFLALRSEPNAETGTRLDQIPNGTVLTVLSCEPESVKIGSRTGRWCLVTYRNNAGWVFDAWLDYEKSYNE